MSNPQTFVQTATLELVNPYPDLALTLVSEDTLTVEPGGVEDVFIEIDTGMVSAGTYPDILLRLNGDNGNTVYGRITVEVTLEALILPDLAVNARDIRLLAYNDDDTITIGATVHNDGNTESTQTVVRFYEFNRELGEADLGAIPAGETGIASITIAMPNEGDRLIRVVADPDETIDELKEDNNEATRIILVGGDDVREGYILITGTLPASVCPASMFSVNGNAVYDLVVDGIRYTDYAVKGGLVDITLIGPDDEAWHFGGDHTDIYGNFSQAVQAPAVPGIYRLITTVTDNTFIGRRELVIEVKDCLSPPTLLPLPPGGGGAGGGGGGGGGDGIWVPFPAGGEPGEPCTVNCEWYWDKTLPEGVPLTDLFVYSEHIHFSDNNPQENEEITVFAEIHYWANRTDRVAQDVPVNIFATYPGIVGDLDPYHGAIDGQVTDITGGFEDVIIDLFDSTGNTLIQSRMTDANGYYLFETVPAGAYLVHIRTPDGYVADAGTKPAEVIEQHVTTVNFFLTMAVDLCGDLDDDGDVDGDDRTILRAAFGTTVNDGGFIEEADYDQDGDIDYSDYQLWYFCYQAFIESL